MRLKKKEAEEKTVKLNSFFFKQRRSRQVIGRWQHRVHMRSSLISMSAAVWLLECAAPLSRSQRSLIRADTGTSVTQDLALAGQYWRHLESC